MVSKPRRMFTSYAERLPGCRADRKRNMVVPPTEVADRRSATQKTEHQCQSYTASETRHITSSLAPQTLIYKVPVCKRGWIGRQCSDLKAF